MTLPALTLAVLVAASPAAPSIATTPAASRLAWDMTDDDAALSTERSSGQLALQIVLGTVVGGVGAATGFAVGLFTGLGACSSYCLIPGLAVGGGLGVAITAPLGVLLASSLTGYHGSVVNAFLFAFLGVIPGAVLSFVPGFQDARFGGFAVLLAGVLPLVGAVVGHAWGVPSQSAPVTWMPTFVPRPGGGTLAVVGRL